MEYIGKENIKPLNSDAPSLERKKRPMGEQLGGTPEPSKKFFKKKRAEKKMLPAAVENSKSTHVLSNAFDAELAENINQAFTDFSSSSTSNSSCNSSYSSSSTSYSDGYENTGSTYASSETFYEESAGRPTEPIINTPTNSLPASSSSAVNSRYGTMLNVNYLGLDGSANPTTADNEEDSGSLSYYEFNRSGSVEFPAVNDGVFVSLSQEDMVVVPPEVTYNGMVESLSQNFELMAGVEDGVLLFTLTPSA